MKIAFFTETFLPKVDGIVTRLTKTVQYLVAAGDEVLIFCPEGAPDSHMGAGVVGVPAGWGIFRLQNEIFSSQRDDSEQNLYRLDLPTLSLSRVISVTTLGIFFKFLATNCLTKVVQIFW